MRKILVLLIFIMSLCIGVINKLKLSAQMIEDDNLYLKEYISDVLGDEWDDYDFENDPNIIFIDSTNEKEMDDLNYIYNSIYFKLNPSYAEHKEENNKYGTCTTIALQILMGYNNYYMDRRIIPKLLSTGEE